MAVPAITGYGRGVGGYPGFGPGGNGGGLPGLVGHDGRGPGGGGGAVRNCVGAPIVDQ